MKNLLAALILAVALAGLSVPLSAQNSWDYNPGKIVDQSSGTFLLNTIGTNTATQVDKPQLTGSVYVLIQSTDNVNFCCSYDSNMSATATAGFNGCMMGQKESGGGFYWLEVRRFWQNLKVWCTTLGTVSGKILRVRQGK